MSVEPNKIEKDENVEFLKAQFKDHSSWVQFTNVVNVDWINTILRQVWPYVCQYLTKYFKEILEPQIQAQIPHPFKSFQFKHIDLGDAAPVVSGLRTYETEVIGVGRLVVDLDLMYAGAADIRVIVGIFNAGLKEIKFRGHCRLVIRPLIPDVPLAGGLAVSFLELPQFGFTLTGVGEIAELPGLHGAIRDVISDQLKSMLVLPNEMTIPLSLDPKHILELNFPEPDGVLLIDVLEARNLMKQDFMGQDDSYVTLAVGAQEFVTKVISNDNNPTFNQTFKAVVGQATGQRLTAKVYDEDNLAADDELGWLSIPIEEIRTYGKIQKWYPLKQGGRGELHLRLYWIDLRATLLSEDDRRVLDSVELSEISTIPSYTFELFVDTLTHSKLKRTLEEKEKDGEGEEEEKPSSTVAVHLSVGGERRETLPVPGTDVHVFKQKIFFFCSQKDLNTDLKITTKDVDGIILSEGTMNARDALEFETLESEAHEIQMFADPKKDKEPVATIQIAHRLRSLVLNVLQHHTL